MLIVVNMILMMMMMMMMMMMIFLGWEPMCGLGWDNWHWENHLPQYLHWPGGHHDHHHGLSCTGDEDDIGYDHCENDENHEDDHHQNLETGNTAKSYMTHTIAVDDMMTIMRMMKVMMAMMITITINQNLETGDTAKSLTTHTVAVDDKIHGPGAPKWVDNPGITFKGWRW